MPKQTDSIELTNSLQGTVEYTASQEIIPEEKILEQGSFTYTSNGERTENPSEGYDGFDTVGVNVNVQPSLQEKSVSYTDNGDNVVEADDGYYGLSRVNVTVDVPQGGVVEPKKGVTFRDCDGTALYSYTNPEFLALDAMPAVPTHSGLTSQGWNWSLVDAKAYITEHDQFLEIGPQYITDDGKTRLYIHLEDRLSPTLGLGVNGTVDIDWGDGSAHSTLTGTSKTVQQFTSHTYSQDGDYIISLAITGIARSNGWSNRSGLLSDVNWGDSSVSKYYRNSLRKIEFGSNFELPGEYGIVGYDNLEYITFSNNCGTTIYNHSFENNYSLKNISIPTCVTTIEYSAFTNCYNLLNVELPNSLTLLKQSVFTNCEELTCFSIPDSVTTDYQGHSGLCQGCYSLTDIVLSKNMSKISGYMFAQCEALSYVFLPKEITKIETTAFSACKSLTNIDIPDTVTDIDDAAFSGSGLISISLPNISTIKRQTFQGCSALREIEIPDTVTNIEYQAFSACHVLNLTLPNALTSIGYEAFNTCYELKNIILPDTLTTIGYGAFQSCYSLNNIEWPSTVTVMNNNVFNGCRALTNITLPNTLTSIGQSAFNSCITLKNIVIPSSVTSIGASAFSSCYSLFDIELPSDTTAINNNLFSNCYSLTSITIPQSVTNIYSNAFANVSLVKITFESSTPPSVANSNVFYNLPTDCKIYVPSGSLTAYTGATNYPNPSTYTYVEY